MQTLVNQTSDPTVYEPILRATSRVNRLYSTLHGYRYSAFLGIKKGTAPVHAAFNRVFLMSELKAAGYTGWYCHLDADAFFGQLNYDLTAYLASNSHHGFIATRASADSRKWAINNGVYFLNMGHPIGRRIVDLYQMYVDQLVPEEYWSQPHAEWPPAAYDDQNILYAILSRNEEILDNMKNEEGVFNCGETGFIRQIVRSHLSFDERLTAIRSSCSKIVDDFVLATNHIIASDN
jgi:hypothetical protein